jgi:hypothetical protein
VALHQHLQGVHAETLSVETGGQYINAGRPGGYANAVGEIMKTITAQLPSLNRLTTNQDLVLGNECKGDYPNAGNPTALHQQIDQHQLTGGQP